MMTNNFAIFAALQPEIQKILDNPLYCWKKNEENLFYSKKHKIFLIISGVGKVFAAYAIAKVLDKVDLIFSFGTSGGLNDEQIGSLYLCTEFIEHDMDCTGLGFPKGITPFSGIENVILSNYSEKTITLLLTIGNKLGINLNNGRIISGDQFLVCPNVSKEKRDFFKANLVDMESAAIAKICVKENKEFLAIRYVSDNANHDSNINWHDNVKKSSIIFDTILEQIVNNNF